MFSILFIFRPGTYDDEFRRLDAATQALGRRMRPRTDSSLQQQRSVLDYFLEVG